MTNIIDIFKGIKTNFLGSRKIKSLQSNLKLNIHKNVGRRII